jgi:hypothetical protein
LGGGGGGGAPGVPPLDPPLKYIYFWTKIVLCNKAVKLRCFRGVCISCSTSGTRRVSLVNNQVISH